MLCEISGSPTSAHYTQIIGHVGDDGNVYNSRAGEAGGEGLDRCVGHIAADGNVYSTAKGFGEGMAQCVGHIGGDGNIYNTPKGAAVGQAGCVGHAGPDGRVYTTPAGVSAGLDACVGQVLSGSREMGAAALLLLLNRAPGGRVDWAGPADEAGSNGSGTAAGPAGSGAATGKRPFTLYKTEGELLKGMAFRLVMLSLLGAGVGCVLTNLNVALGVVLGLLVGGGLTLFLTMGASSVAYHFDTVRCKSAMLRCFFRRPAFWGIIFPVLLWAAAALILLSLLSGSPSLALSLCAVGLAMALGAGIGRAIRRRRGK